MSEPSPDVLEMRNYIYSLMELDDVQSVLDIGCGKGYDLHRIGEMLGPDARLVGIDSMPKQIDAAKSEIGDDPRFEFQVADVSAGLPFGNADFDLVYSRDLLECIPDKDSLTKEVHRVLKPGGQVVFAHWDWDSQVIDGNDKDLVRKIVHTFGDWKQAWMADCDSWMGRRLWRVFNRSGLFSGKVCPYVVTNTEFAPGYRGYETIKGFSALVRRGMVLQEEYDRFYQDIQDLAEKGEYFYAVATYIFVGNRS